MSHTFPAGMRVICKQDGKTYTVAEEEDGNLRLAFNPAWFPVSMFTPADDTPPAIAEQMSQSVPSDAELDSRNKPRPIWNGRSSPKPAPKPTTDERSNGVARAVDRLSSGQDHLLGSARFEP